MVQVRRRRAAQPQHPAQQDVCRTHHRPIKENRKMTESKKGFAFFLLFFCLGWPPINMSFSKVMARRTDAAGY